MDEVPGEVVQVCTGTNIFTKFVVAGRIPLPLSLHSEQCGTLCEAKKFYTTKIGGKNNINLNDLLGKHSCVTIILTTSVPTNAIGNNAEHPDADGYWQ